MSKFLTIKQVAALLGCSEFTVERLLHTHINPNPYFRVGALLRVDAGDLQFWIDRRKADASASRIHVDESLSGATMRRGRGRPRKSPTILTGTASGGAR